MERHPDWVCQSLGTGAAEGGVGYSCVLPLTDAFSVLGLMAEETTDLIKQQA